jgi:hypothetical protein
MKRFPISLAVSLLAITFAPLAFAANLAWKFTPGDEQNYRLTQSSRLDDAAAENKQLASIEQSLDLTWKVLEVSEAGEAKISLAVTAFSLVAKGPGGQDVHYDSESTEEAQGYAAMLAPIGKRLADSPLVFKMNAQGEISDVQLPEELAEAVKSVPGGKKFAQDGGLASFETLARLGAPLNPPAGEVTAEQTWAAIRNMEVPVLGMTKAEFTYKVASPISEEEITIEQHLLLALAGTEQVAKLDNQKSSGTIVWDAVKGRPETSTLNYEVEIDQTESEGGSLKLEQNTEFRRLADETQ